MWLTAVFFVLLFTTGKIRKHPNYPVKEEWRHCGKNKEFAISENMEKPGRLELKEINQTQQEREKCVISLTCKVYV
jgi:hypothetical protein